MALLWHLSRIVASLFFLYITSCIYNFCRNIIHARKTNLPYILVPVSQQAIPWVAASVPLRGWLKDRLPTFLWRRVAITIYGWEWQDRVEPFTDIAGSKGNKNSFVIAGLGKIELWTRDPDIANDILQRPDDFKQVEISNTILSLVGDNVFSTDGSIWRRHRKVVASVINERISRAVWDESIKQTQGLLTEVFRNGNPITQTAQTDQLPDMLKKVTIHVLSGAGMGTSKSWNDDDNDKPRPGYKQTYIECVQTLMQAMVGAAVLPQWFAANYPSFLPGYNFLKRMHFAKLDFPKYTQEMLDSARQRDEKGHGNRHNSNILTELVNAQKTEGKQKALSDSELCGNLFIFQVAGFETTANTLTFAFAMLARHPVWQDWLLEEIDSVLSQSDIDDTPDYSTVFPKLHRVMAFLLETLRLFPPLIHITKMTAAPGAVQSSTSGRHMLPGKVLVYIHVLGLHTLPEIWRDLNPSGAQPPSGYTPEHEVEDELNFRPTRWLNPPDTAHPMFQPPKGTFLPWSTGPRVCPGQKMAQVEFTAIFLTLLQGHRIDAFMDGTARREDINSRLDAQIKDSMSVVTLQMNNVYDMDATQAGKGLRLQLTKRVGE